MVQEFKKQKQALLEQKR